MINEKQEKIIIYASIILICIILIVTIIFIWKPLFKSVLSEKINEYDINLKYETEMEKYYKDYLNENLKITNFETLYENISEDYMNNYIGTTDKETVKKYLRDNNLISMNFNITDINYSENNYSAVFAVRYFVNGNEKIVNVKESKPFKFTIDFSNNSSMNSILGAVNLDRNIDNVNYKVEFLNSQMNSVKIKLTIINNSANTYKFDFQNLNSMQLRYNNNYVNMSMIANSSTVNYEITPGSSKSIQALFAVPFSEQLKIEGIKFNNVKVNGISQNIEL